jgi:hypothetical protein
MVQISDEHTEITKKCYTMFGLDADLSLILWDNSGIENSV